jgi:hypothetical protein
MCRAVGLAQETRGSIEGVIKDTSGAVLPGVTVEARGPALVGVSRAITAEVIDRIPKGRDFAGVLVQAPGASNETKAGGYQLDGSSGSENHFLVDGLDMTSLRTGTQNNFGNNTAGNTPTNPIRTDFVAEVQVKSSGYNAEYRAATGGVVSVLTKTRQQRLARECWDVLRSPASTRLPWRRRRRRSGRIRGLGCQISGRIAAPRGCS